MSLQKIFNKLDNLYTNDASPIPPVSDIRDSLDVLTNYAHIVPRRAMSSWADHEHTLADFVHEYQALLLPGTKTSYVRFDQQGQERGWTADERESFYKALEAGQLNETYLNAHGIKKTNKFVDEPRSSYDQNFLQDMLPLLNQKFSEQPDIVKALDTAERVINNAEDWHNLLTQVIKPEVALSVKNDLANANQDKPVIQLFPN